MRKIEKRETTDDVVVERTCDMCGAEALSPGDRDFWHVPEQGLHDDENYGPNAEITVLRRDGYNYAGGEYDPRGTQRFDICPACWDKVAAFIRQK